METWCDRWMCVCVKPLFHKDKVYKSSLDPPQYHTNANKMSPLRNPYGGMVCDRCVSTEYNSTRYQLWVGVCVCVYVWNISLAQNSHLFIYLFRLSLFRVAPFSENTAFQGQGGPDIQNATT